MKFLYTTTYHKKKKKKTEKSQKEETNDPSTHFKYATATTCPTSTLFGYDKIHLCIRLKTKHINVNFILHTTVFEGFLNILLLIVACGVCYNTYYVYKTYLLPTGYIH